MAEYSSSKIRYFSIRKNMAGAKTYDIKVKLNTTLDPQIGSTSEQLVGKDITFAERTDDGGGEFKCTIKATGDGKGGYIKIKTLKSLLSYKGQLVLLSLSELEYSGSYIAKDVKYTETKGKVTKERNGTITETSGVYEVDVTFQKVKDQPVTFPSNNATKTPDSVKQNNATKTGIASLSTEYQDYYNNCQTLSYTTHKDKRNVKCVTTTQKLLQKNKLYLKCKIDGWFYTCTRDNVIAFKKKKKLTPYNSVVDKTVRKALLEVLMK